MKILAVFVISCLIYQVSAGGLSYSSSSSAPAPPTRPLCVDCEDFYKNAAPLSIQTCDPVNKSVCVGEAIEAAGNNVITGYCAGTVTNPYPQSERSQTFSAGDIICF